MKKGSNIKKRIFSFVMVLVMCLGFAVPVMAQPGEIVRQSPTDVTIEWPINRVDGTVIHNTAIVHNVVGQSSENTAIARMDGNFVARFDTVYWIEPGSTITFIVDYSESSALSADVTLVALARDEYDVFRFFGPTIFSNAQQNGVISVDEQPGILTLVFDLAVFLGTRTDLIISIGEYFVGLAPSQETIPPATPDFTRTLTFPNGTITIRNVVSTSTMMPNNIGLSEEIIIYWLAPLDSEITFNFPQLYTDRQIHFSRYYITGNINNVLNLLAEGTGLQEIETLSDGSLGILLEPESATFLHLSLEAGVSAWVAFTNNPELYNPLLLQQQQPTPATPDLSTASTWAHEHIIRAIELNLVPQNLQGAYAQATTRAEFAAFAVALYQSATSRTITGRMEFDDTTDPNVQMMGYLGVVTGVGGGNFNPNGELTREQAAVMIARLADVVGQPLPASAPTFADNADISAWAIDAVGQMQAANIMGGVGDNLFAPAGDYTREQSIITILRLFDILS